MADISPRTQNVSIQDDTTAELATVNADNDLLVHDQDAQDLLTEIRDGTTVIEQSVTSNWEYFAQIDRAFATTYGATFGGGSGEKEFVLLENPASSGITARIKGVTFSILSTSTNATFRLYKDHDGAVTTLGDPLNIGNYRDDGVTGLVNTYSVPSSAGFTTPFLTYDLNSGGTGSATFDVELALIILEGEYLYISVEQYGNNKTFSMNISWAEEDIPA